MNESVKERLIAYLSKKGVNKSEFGRSIGVSAAFVTSIRQSIQPDKLERISKNYPDLNIDWLLTGNGEMLYPSINQTVNGDGNTAVAGNGNHVNTELGKALEEIAAQRRVTEKAQEQIDRLLGIIERMNK